MSVGIANKILRANTDVNTAVGGRIYSLISQPGTKGAYIVLYSDGSKPVSTMHEPTTKQYNSIIVACYASSLSLVKSIAEKVKQALEHYQGTVNSTQVEWVSYEGDNPEDYDEKLKLATVESNYKLTVKN